MKIFALSDSQGFGAEVAGHMGVSLSPHEDRGFEDGERKVRPLVGVRRADAVVIESLHGQGNASVHDKLCQLLFFIATLFQNGAASVTAVTPYLAYMRKDRQTKARDPVTSRYIAELFEAVGTNCLITLEAHNFPAFQNAFRCRSIHLDPGYVFAETVAGLLQPDEPVAVVSPDAGGIKRAQLFRETLETTLGRPVNLAFCEKRRSSGVVTGGLLAGDVGSGLAVVIDDLISTGGTLARAAELCLGHGARRVIACAAHGVFAESAKETLANAPFERVFVTDSVAPDRARSMATRQRVEVLSVAPLFAEAIRRDQVGGSISDLLAMGQ